MQSGYTLGQLAVDAHFRVVYGECRSTFLQGAKKLQNKLVKRAGLLGEIGPTRATQSDHQIKPDLQASYSVDSSRSLLDGMPATLGMQSANAIPTSRATGGGAWR